MGYNVRLTQEARSDLDDAVTYITERLSNRAAAESLITEFTEKLQLLAASPEIYTLCENPRLRKNAYRRFIIGNYIVFYKISEIDETVYIIRMIYGKRDYLKIL